MEKTFYGGCSSEITLLSVKLPPRALCCHRRRPNFSLVARYSLKLTSSLLLVVKSLVTRCQISSLLVAKNYSFLIAKFARYLLQKLLVAKNHSLLVAKFTCYSLHKITRYSLQNSLVTCYRSCSLQKITCY